MDVSEKINVTDVLTSYNIMAINDKVKANIIKA